MYGFRSHGSLATHYLVLQVTSTTSSWQQAKEEGTSLSLLGIHGHWVNCQRSAMLSLQCRAQAGHSDLPEVILASSFKSEVKLSRARKSCSRGGVLRPLMGPWRGNNGWAALSTAPQGSLCPGASLQRGGSWSSFVALFSTSVQKLKRWIQRIRKIGILKFGGYECVCGPIAAKLNIPVISQG